MTLRKPKASKAQARNRPSRRVAIAVGERINENPDVRVVLETATRAHVLESREPPRYIGVATDIAVTSANSQYPVS
jgi:hypothetical protein